MKRNQCVKGYEARKSERAIEKVIGATLEKLSLNAKVVKFGHNENENSREIKWDIHLKEESDAEKLSEILDIPFVDVINYGALDGDFVVTLSLLWKTDTAEEQLRLERKIVEEVEKILNTEILEGVEDINILKGEFVWGEIEEILY